MPGRLPSGFHWIDSRNKRAGARNPTTGEQLSRHQAETRGARETGYSSTYEQRQAARHTAILKQDPGADGGRYFSARTNYRHDLQKSKDTAALLGQKWDRSARARFDAIVGGMQVPDPAGRREAHIQFLLITGRVGTRREATYSP